MGEESSKIVRDTVTILQHRTKMEETNRVHNIANLLRREIGKEVDRLVRAGAEVQSLYLSKVSTALSQISNTSSISHLNMTTTVTKNSTINAVKQKKISRRVLIQLNEIKSPLKEMSVVPTPPIQQKNLDIVWSIEFDNILT